MASYCNNGGLSPNEVVDNSPSLGMPYYPPQMMQPYAAYAQPQAAAYASYIPHAPDVYQPAAFQGYKLSSYPIASYPRKNSECLPPSGGHLISQKPAALLKANPLIK